MLNVRNPNGKHGCRFADPCDKKPVRGSRFCREHRDRLAVIRDELTDKRERHANGSIRSPKRAPTCCFIGCYEPRLRSETFCATHRDEGHDEE